VGGLLSAGACGGGLQDADGVVDGRRQIGRLLPMREVSRTYFHRRAWAPAVKHVGLPAGTRYHELPHFYASR
jgi:hypothetical protein